MAKDFNFEDMIPQFDETEFEDLSIEEDIIPPNEGFKEEEEEEKEDEFQMSPSFGEEGVEEDEEEEEDPNPKEVDPVAKGTYETLVEKGILSESEDFDGTLDFIENQLENLPQAVANSLVSNAPEVGQNLIDYIFTRGKDLTREDLHSFMSTHMEDLMPAVEREFTEVKDALEYIEESLKKTYSGTRAKLMAEAILDEGDEAVIEEAKSIYEKEKESTPKKAKALLEKEKDQQADKVEKQRKFVSKVLEEVDSLEWKDKRKNTIKLSLAKNLHEEALSSAYGNPKAFVQLVDFLTYFNKETNEFDLTAFIAARDSKVTKKIKDKASSDRWSSSGSTSSGKRGNAKGNDFFSSHKALI